MYVPDRWVKLKIEQENKETIYKIIGGWSGGYLDSDSWRMNSGIVREEKGEEDGHSYTDYIGYSGSVYRCFLGSNGTSLAFAGILNQLLEASDLAKVTIVDPKEEENNK